MFHLIIIFGVFNIFRIIPLPFFLPLTQLQSSYI